MEVEEHYPTCGRCGLKNHQSADCRVFFKPARNANKWVEKLNNQLTVTNANKGVVADKTLNSSSKSSSPKRACFGVRSGATIEDEVRLPLSSLDHKGFSDNEINYDLDLGDEFLLDDELANINPRSISQLANILLGKAKGGRGRKSNRQKREDRSKEKGIISVMDFLRKTKGNGLSLGEK